MVCVMGRNMEKWGRQRAGAMWRCRQGREEVVMAVGGGRGSKRGGEHLLRRPIDSSVGMYSATPANTSAESSDVNRDPHRSGK